MFSASSYSSEWSPLLHPLVRNASGVTQHAAVPPTWRHYLPCTLLCKVYSYLEQLCEGDFDT
jgi:hypothetical protein